MSHALIHGMLGIIIFSQYGLKSLIHGMLGIIFFSKYGLKRGEKVAQAWRDSNTGHQHKRHPPFHYTTTMFASICQVLSILYICIPCFNSNKKGGAIEDSNRGHQDKSKPPYQCAKPWFVQAMGNKYFYILLFLSQVFAHILDHNYILW